jgi:hypothetical protein
LNTRKLQLEDIADARAYEREREEFRSRIIALKKVRRVVVGPAVSVVFENRDTIRFQIQEMARAERLMTDAAIQTELDVYNPLIPGPGDLSATLYIELTSRAEMEEWLPKLVGIEQSVQLEIGGHEGAASSPERSNGSVPERNTGSVPERNTGSVPERNTGSVPERSNGFVPERNTGFVPERNNGSARPTTIVRADVDPSHAAALTREEVTAAVHFLHFSLTAAQIERFRAETVAVAIDHPQYRERTLLSAETKTSLLDDLLG